MSEKQQRRARQQQRQGPALCIVGQPSAHPESDAIAAELQRFYRSRRKTVVAYLRGERPGENDLAPHEFVDRIHNEWRQQFATRGVPETAPAERTFWFALFLIEEHDVLGDVPVFASDPVTTLPRVGRLGAELRVEMLEIANLLERGKPLPPQLYVSRPGEKSLEEMLWAEDMDWADGYTGEATFEDDPFEEELFEAGQFEAGQFAEGQFEAGQFEDEQFGPADREEQNLE